MCCLARQTTTNDCKPDGISIRRMTVVGPRPARRTPMHYVASYAAHDGIRFSATELASIRRPIHTNRRLIRFQPVAHSHVSDPTGEHVMDRALYSIEETRARLGGISRNSLYTMLRAGDLPSVVIGCRRFISAEAIAALITNSTTSISPSQDAVRSRRPLVNVGQGLSSTARLRTRSRKFDAE